MLISDEYQRKELTTSDEDSNEDKMAVPWLTGLPSEAWLCVLLHLQPADLCSVRATAPSLALLVDREAVWVGRAWCDYAVRLRPAPDFSPRQFYQAVLHRYGCSDQLFVVFMY